MHLAAFDGPHTLDCRIYGRHAVSLSRAIVGVSTLGGPEAITIQQDKCVGRTFRGELQEPMFIIAALKPIGGAGRERAPGKGAVAGDYQADVREAKSEGHKAAIMQAALTDGFRTAAPVRQGGATSVVSNAVLSTLAQ